MLAVLDAVTGAAVAAAEASGGDVVDGCPTSACGRAADCAAAVRVAPAPSPTAPADAIFAAEFPAV